MSEQSLPPENPAPPAREPVFLLPGAVTATIAVFVVIHLLVTFVFTSEEQVVQVIFWFAFQPLRVLAITSDPGLGIPLLWTPFSHALLHGGWEHLIVNVAWFAIFATPITRRYGATPMLLMFFVSAAAGAALFAAVTLYSGSYLIGASGGVAGLTGAATRFIFQPVIFAEHPQTGQRIAVGRQLASLGDLWRDSRARFFVLIWVLLNAAVPLLPLLTGTSMQVAWQAHLGGFFAGLLMVGLFEGRGR